MVYKTKNASLLLCICLLLLFGTVRLSFAANFTILAANDLGMHCADQDFRIFSILPPYNVLNAQVLMKGSKPQIMSPDDGIHVTYK
ncbi:MAG: carboxypeptidase regulatory-like domain-containing protein, partial [gamma proteobacterium symbiont of Bathyaustriella thionipta]|nr:carboxypeptidase regulatory-like domain-containing protein [gamma proteobacterium symbiont of Bathyaustriella thionipta]